MTIECGMREQLSRRVLEQGPWSGALLGQRAIQIERTTDLAGRFAGLHATVGHFGEQLGELVHQTVAQLAERGRVDRERDCAGIGGRRGKRRGRVQGEVSGNSARR